MMKNDHKGIIEEPNGVRSLYASGQHGPEVRADGSGGLMARGYYGQPHKHHVWIGPFKTRVEAILDAHNKITA